MVSDAVAAVGREVGEPRAVHEVLLRAAELLRVRKPTVFEQIRGEQFLMNRLNP